MKVQMIGLDEAVQVALEITSSFEGNHGWSEVVGDFDGQGITCGALGFAWAAGIHQKIVLKSEESAPGIAKKLMPLWGEKYLAWCAEPPKSSLKKIQELSTRGKLNPEIAGELRQLWGSQPMIQAQILAAKTVYLRQATKDMERWGCKSLRGLCFFFDNAIQSGSIGHVPSELKGNELAAAIEFLRNAKEDQSGFDDARKNALIWSQMSPTGEQSRLFAAAYLRAKRSSYRWQYSVLNRRGTIVFGCGWVNRSLRDFQSKITEREVA